MERLKEAVRIALKYLKVGASPYRLLQHLWWEHVTFEKVEQKLTFYTLAELHKAQEEEKVSWLSTVATRLYPSASHKLIGMETSVQRLIDLERSPFQRSMILIGPRGVGKSEIVYQWLDKSGHDKVWETSATYLIRKLTNNFGWQANLMTFIKDNMSLE